MNHFAFNPENCYRLCFINSDDVKSLSEKLKVLEACDIWRFLNKALFEMNEIRDFIHK